MAKPRVFVSSTYYDLKHIRASLENFISELGYEPVLFESGDIPFHHEKPLDENCYDAIEHAHIFVLIIGGRYGSSASGQTKLPTKSNKLTDEELDNYYTFYNSVTFEEYKRARTHDLPIYVFLEKGVSAEYQTYKENRDIKIKYAHVDNVGVFRLLDSIFSEDKNNLVREFDSISHITSWLRDQWAGLMADFLSRKKTDSALQGLTTQVETLNQVVDALKSYSEAIVKKIEPDSAKLILQIEKKLAAEIVQTNSLIRYLRRGSIKSGSHSLEIDKIIDAVINSGNPNDLGKRLNLSESEMQRLAESENAAWRDLSIMRRKLSELTTYEEMFKAAPPIEMREEDDSRSTTGGISALRSASLRASREATEHALLQAEAALQVQAPVRTAKTMPSRKEAAKPIHKTKPK